MGYQGLIMTDCMEMHAIAHTIGTVQGAVQAIKAGADMVLISHTASTAEAAAAAISEAIDAGDIAAAEWEQSLTRIAILKNDYLSRPVPDYKIVGCESNKDTNFKLLQQTLTSIRVPGGQFPELGDNPYFVGCPAFRATMVSNRDEDPFAFPVYMAEKLNGKALVTASNPAEDEIDTIVQQAADASCIVVGTYNGHLYKGQLELVNRLASGSVPVIAVALRNPYDLRHLNPAVWSLAAYEYTDQVFDAVANVLQGKEVAAGKPTVTVLIKESL